MLIIACVFIDVWGMLCVVGGVLLVERCFMIDGNCLRCRVLCVNWCLLFIVVPGLCLCLCVSCELFNVCCCCVVV